MIKALPGFLLLISALTFFASPSGAVVDASAAKSIISLAEKKSSAKIDFDSQAKVFPNPFRHTFSVDISTSDFNKAILTDVLGKNIISINLTESVTRIGEGYNYIESLPEGVYFLTLIGDGGKQTIRVIKSYR
jgi:hypothetical protein